MALLFSDFKFTHVEAYEPILIKLGAEDDWLQLDITVKRAFVGNITLAYEAMSIEDDLKYWLHAFIDVLPEYAAIDKYFNYIRTRSRCYHTGDSGLYIRWEIRVTGRERMQVLVRTNFDADAEDEDEYCEDHDEEAVKKVKGEVLLSVEVSIKQWIAALVKALEELLNTWPAETQFPHTELRMLQLWLQIPPNPHKADKLQNALKGVWQRDNDNFVVNP